MNNEMFFVDNIFSNSVQIDIKDFSSGNISMVLPPLEYVDEKKLLKITLDSLILNNLGYNKLGKQLKLKTTKDIEMSGTKIFLRVE